ncbi:hypothetical protein D3C79_370030 [compost metagenome]
MDWLRTGGDRLAGDILIFSGLLMYLRHTLQAEFGVLRDAGKFNQLGHGAI